jgi:hypothetical protein
MSDEATSQETADVQAALLETVAAELVQYGLSVEQARRFVDEQRDELLAAFALRAPRHGTESAYTNHGCRCASCKAASAAARRRRRQKQSVR